MRHFSLDEHIFFGYNHESIDYSNLGGIEMGKYIIQLIHKYDLKLIWIILVANILGVISNISSIIFPRVVIEGLQNNMEMIVFSKRIMMLAGLCMMSSFFEHYTKSVVFVRSMSLRFRVLIETGNLYTRMPYSLVEDQSFVDLSSQADRATADNNVGIEGVLHEIASLGGAFLTVIWTSIMLLRFPILLLLLLIVLIGNSYISMQREKENKKMEDAQVRPTRIWNTLNKNMQSKEAYKDIVLYQFHGIFKKYLDTLYLERGIAMKIIQKRNIQTKLIFEGIKFGAMIFIYVILGFKTLNGSLSLGEYMTYSLCCSTLLSCAMELVNTCSYIYHQADIIMDHQRYVDRLKELSVDGKALCTTVERIEFNNVSFSYPFSQNKILSHMSFNVEMGKKIAIVGLNGAGKTTIISLLMGLYHPDNGEILINGKDYKEYNQTSLFELFSPAFQDTNLYAFTIAENISMKSLENTNIDRVVECCKALGLHERISKLPKGYLQSITKIIDDTGVLFSGGECQKIGMARALYKNNASVLVLDEPTASYDAIVESDLYQRLESICKNKTVFFISHRLASTQFCDKIIFLANGTIAESGSHKELLANKADYANLYQIQGKYYQEVD